MTPHMHSLIHTRAVPAHTPNTAHEHTCTRRAVFINEVMHGLIHVILKDFVLTKFGEDPWYKILVELNVTDDTTILDVNEQYDDATTVLAVTTAAKVLGVSFDDALRAYGAHFVGYVAAGGYLRMLLSMGDDLTAFLGNVNHLHHNLERKFREARFPVFHVEQDDQKCFFSLLQFFQGLGFGTSRGRRVAGSGRGTVQATRDHDPDGDTQGPLLGHVARAHFTPGNVRANTCGGCEAHQKCRLLARGAGPFHPLLWKTSRRWTCGHAHWGYQGAFTEAER